MITKNKSELEKEIIGLRAQLAEANDTIEAIRTGQVDALIVNKNNSHQVYTLKSADQSYRVFIEKMREGAVTLGPGGIILYSNSSFAQMVGFPLSGVIGCNLEKFVFRKHKTLFSSLFKKSWAKASKGELALITQQNEIVPVLLSLTTLQLDDGTALSVIVTDLTLQKETENQLQQKNHELLKARDELSKLNDQLEQKVEMRTKELFTSREHFKFLADNIPVIVWMAGHDGNINYFNSQWYEYSGLDFENSKNHGWQKVLQEEDKANVAAAWLKSIKTGNPFYSEQRMLRVWDNSFRWHVSKALPFKNSDGQITQWFGINMDIEEQKAALRRKDEFISMASHELKTPVTILKAFNQMLYQTFKKQDNPDAYDFVAKMEKQVNRLDKLIADLLDATRADTNEISFEKDFFDFNTMVEEVSEQIQLTCTTHKIEVKPAKTTQIFGDRNRLAQVVSNLITNGIKYSPYANSVLITSQLAPQFVKLCVQDFGIGIPQSEQPKLFNRFFRGSDVKTNTYPGLGLGLYISNQIVKGHSGALTFESEEGNGSVFCMTLPLTSAQ